MKRIIEIWECKSGRLSFKRIFGTAAFVVGSITAFTTKDIGITALFITAATTAAGLGLGEKGNLNDNCKTE